MNRKIINIVKITLLLVVAMFIHPKEFKTWEYLIVLFGLPNVSLIIWLVIEWIRFNPNEEIEKDETF